MSSLDFVWSLFNSRNEVQIDGLTTLQAQAIVSSITPKDLQNWLAWREGLKEWAPAADFTELFSQTAITRIPPAPPKINKLRRRQDAVDIGSAGIAEKPRAEEPKSYTPEEGELEKVDLLIQEYSNKDARVTARFEKNYAVVVRFDHFKCDAFTVNISRGGMKLDRLLPSAAAGAAIVVEITRRENTLTLNCQAIPEPKAPGGVSRLIISKTSDDELLRGWLLEPGKI